MRTASVTVGSMFTTNDLQALKLPAFQGMRECDQTSNLLGVFEAKYVQTIVIDKGAADIINSVAQ